MKTCVCVCMCALEAKIHTLHKSLSYYRGNRERKRGMERGREGWRGGLHGNDWKVLNWKTVYLLNARQFLVHFNNSFYLEENNSALFCPLY